MDFICLRLTKSTDERTEKGKKKLKSENWRVTNATTQHDDMRNIAAVREYMVYEATHEKPSKINDQNIWHFQITFLHAIALFTMDTTADSVKTSTQVN